MRSAAGWRLLRELSGEKQAGRRPRPHCLWLIGEQNANAHKAAVRKEHSIIDAGHEWRLRTIQSREWLKSGERYLTFAKAKGFPGSGPVLDPAMWHPSRSYLAISHQNRISRSLFPEKQNTLSDSQALQTLPYIYARKGMPPLLSERLSAKKGNQMAKPKLYTDAQLTERKRTRNQAAMRHIRRAARGIPDNAPPYAGLAGELNPTARLTAKDVRKARQMREAGHTIAHLAEIFGVAKSTMHNALSGKTWKG